MRRTYTQLKIRKTPAMQELKEMQVQSLGQKDPLKEETTTLPQYSRKIPWTENPGGLQSTGHKESDMTEHSSAL